MYRRRPKSSSNSSIGLTGSNRGSDITKPNNTSLIVQRSRISEESDEDLPKSVTALLYDDDDDSDSIELARPSTSVMNSMTQKIQSTPQGQNNRVLRDSNSLRITSKSSSTTETDSSFIPEKPYSRSGTFQKSKSKATESSSEFLRILQLCGTEEIEGDASFKLCEDQAVFIRKLDEIMKDETIKINFIKSLNDYLKNDEKLMKLVMLTQTSSDCEVARGPVQEPMLRLLLLSDQIQGDLLPLLLKRMEAIITHNNLQLGIPLITGILKQVQCLSRVQSTKFGSCLFSLIETAPPAIQKEIIFLMPELIIEEELEETTKKLAELLQAGSELTPIIIDSLGNLPLTRALKVEVCEKVMMRLERYPAAFLPNLVQFILSRSDPQDQMKIVTILRGKLTFNEEPNHTQGAKRGPDVHIRKTFGNIVMALKASKSLTEVWLKVIAGAMLPDDFRPIDLMVLVLIHGHVLGRKAGTLTLVKNRIRAGMLTESLINTTFKVFRSVIIENHKEVLDLASSLLKSFENIIADVAVSMYKELFSGCGPFLRQDVVSDLVMHLTAGSPSTVNHALTVLLRLRETESATLEQHAASFMCTLRMLPNLDLTHARLLADVVSGLVSAPSQKDSGLVEELCIFIRKQMSAWQQETQHRGVVAAVMAIKHFAIQNADQTSEDLMECSALLKMAAGTHSACAARRTFFFDEIASMLKEVTARPTFLTAWIDRIYTQALEIAFASNLDLECDHFPMSLQYSIENGGNLVIPIVGLIVNPKNDPYINATTIPSALRTLWCSSKDISRITPMMCAAVILPDNSVYDKFLTYQVSEQKLIMDCLFLCANFFIECVNALATQKTSEKLIIRLKQLIEVRKLILKFVGQIPNYTPPFCQFHVPANKLATKKQSSDGGKKTARGRKRKSDGRDAAVPGPSQANLDTSVLPATSTAAPAEAFAQVPTIDENADLSSYVAFFRELHCHSYKLLRMELKLNPSKVFKKKKMSDVMVSDVSWSYRPEDKPELGPSDTLFLLQDYLIKSDQILRERLWFLNRKPSGLVTETMGPATFIGGSIKLLPKLCLKLDVVHRYCKDLLDSNDGVWDAPGCFPNDSADIKRCYTSLLKIISDILAWRGFQNPSNKDLLKDILFILSRKTAMSSTQIAGSLAIEAARFLSGLSPSLHLLPAAVYLTRSIHSCIQLSGTKDFSLVGDLCDEILKRPWFTVTGTTDRGVIYNQMIDSLIRIYLACADDRLELVLKIAEISAEEVPGLLTKDSPLVTYASLNKSNFPLLFRALCETLATAATEQLTAKKDSDEDCIRIWAVVVRTLLILVEIAKVHTSRTNLAALLKRSQTIIQQFLSKGLPVMENALRVKSDDVLKILKSLQAVTRFLHSVCCHSKMTSDAVVAAHVPNIRAICERLTLEVKGMLILNKIPLDCITIAVLKNRDIQGNAILSQSTVTTSDDESELPVEDEPDLPTDTEDLEVGEEPSDSS